MVEGKFAVGRARKVLGYCQIVGESSIVLMMLSAVPLRMVGTDRFESFVTVAVLLSFMLSVSSRFGACAILMEDEQVRKENRADECIRFLSLPGWRASRYLRTGKLER